MASTEQLLRQIRRAAAAARGSSDNADAQDQLGAADVALNTLQLQTDPAFYLSYLAQGRELLSRGHRLLLDNGARATDPFVLRDDLTPEIRQDVIDAEVTRLHACLVGVVEKLDEGRSPREKAFLVALSQWEAGLYGHQARQAATSASDAGASGAAELTASSFEAYLRARSPTWRDLRVTRFVRLTGGFSKLTVLVDVEGARSGSQSMVIRAQQAVDILRYEGSDVAQEFHMIALMQRAGLPIAEPLWIESDPRHFGMQFIVSRKAVGRTFGGSAGTSEALSPALVQDVVATLGRLHRVEIDPADPLAQRSHLKEWLPHRTMRAVATHYATEYLPRLIRLTGIPPSPQLARGVLWLRRNVPDCDEPPVVVHIDFGLHNLIIDNDRVSAVLDWESSRLGDPADDLIWTQQNLAGQLSMPELLERHAAGTGLNVSAYRLAYARVAKCALAAITCMSAMQALHTQDTAQMKLAVLAYRYHAIFGAQFNELIEQAEQAR